MTDPIGTAQERELIERLENEEMRLAGQSIDRGCVDSGLSATLAREAADALQSRIAEVGRLEERVQALEDALNPFAREADDWGDKMDCEELPADATDIKISDLRKARAALSLHRRPT